MKQQLIFGTIMIAATSLLAAEAKQEVTNAAKKLAQAGGYSWKSTVEGGNARFRAGPTEGKVAKDGLTHLSMTRGENKTETYLKGGKGAIKTGEEWQSLTEAGEGDGGQGRAFLVRMLKSFKNPAEQAQELASKTKELKKDEDTYSGDLTEEGAKELLTRGRGEASDAKGSVKFWVKDGLLSKYEFKLQGKMSVNGNDIDIDRTTTTEIKDVGTTKVEAPDDAKKKLS
jgi:hypothetical protein